jgi:ATP-binding cassette subfamily B protein
LLDTRAELVEASDAVDVTPVAGTIGFERVSFHYDVRPLPGVPAPAAAITVLSELDLQIPAGQTVAFVGATGAGKTTLVKLLLRFYDPKHGAITLDGVDLRRLSLSSLRRAVGLVSHDVFLFHGSVRENIAFGSFVAPLERIVEAATTAEAHEFISRLPHGYDTIVGERGQKLSGGQRQRISIARAIVKDPPVLILDEATSSVDNETEAAIQRSLERIAVGRTTIVIAHRLSTVRRADRIFVVERGAVAEVGTHDELVERDGTYAKLWQVQTGLGAGA